MKTFKQYLNEAKSNDYVLGRQYNITNPRHLNAIKKYTHEDYQDDKDKILAAHGKDFDELTTQHPAKSNFTIYRGMSKPNLSFTTKTPTSFSANKNLARTLGPIEKPYNESHILKVDIKKGTRHGAYIGHHAVYDAEDEFLLKKNTKINVHPTPHIETLKNGDKIHTWSGTIES